MGAILLIVILAISIYLMVTGLKQKKKKLIISSLVLFVTASSASYWIWTEMQEYDNFRDIVRHIN